MTRADASALRPWLDSPHSAGLFIDFDGTLSEVVADAAKAAPLEGVRGVLNTLGERFRVVAIVSGRSASELVDWLGLRVEIWGLHGAERAVDGKIELTDVIAPYRDRMERTRDEAERRAQELAIHGVTVEDKGVMLGLHWRQAEDPEAAATAVTALARGLAERYGLITAPGRMVIELRPPVELSKYDVVMKRVREEALAAAAFVGDDYVDLAAFDALDELQNEGVATLRVGVLSDETPKELEDRADVTVQGPRGALEWLQALTA